jgi:hypothetical protein
MTAVAMMRMMTMLMVVMIVVDWSNDGFRESESATAAPAAMGGQSEPVQIAMRRTVLPTHTQTLRHDEKTNK